MAKNFILVLLLAMITSNSLLGTAVSEAAGNSKAKDSPPIPARIMLTIEEKTLTATLSSSKVAKNLLSALPLTLPLNDLFGREKYARLPRPLSEEGKRSREYEVGTIAYWPPGQDVVIFYRHGGPEIPEPGIIILGKIDSGVEALKDLLRPTKIIIQPD